MALENTLHYVDIPSQEPTTRPPLVLLHGLHLSRKMWEPQIAALSSKHRAIEALHQKHRVIVPDQRGCGKTPLNLGGDTPPPSLDVQTEDLQRLFEELKLAEAVLIGFSKGGRDALHFLHMQKQQKQHQWLTKISGIVLANTSASADDKTARGRRRHRAAEYKSEGRFTTRQEFIDSVASGLSREQRSELTGYVTPVENWQSAAWHERALANRPDHRKIVEAADMPMLVMTAGNDKMMPPELSYEIFHTAQDACRDATLVELPRLGHMSNLQDPIAFNRPIQDFLDGVYGSPTLKR